MEIEYLSSTTGYYKVKKLFNKPIIYLENSKSDNFRIILNEDEGIPVSFIERSIPGTELFRDIKTIYRDKINDFLKTPGSYYKRMWNEPTYLKNIGKLNLVITSNKMYLTRYNTAISETSSIEEFNSQLSDFTKKLNRRIRI